MKKLFLLLFIVFMVPALQAMEPGTGDIPGEKGEKERTFEHFGELPPEVKFEIALALIPKSIKTGSELSKVFAGLLRFGLANAQNLVIIQDPVFLKRLERQLMRAIVEPESVLTEVPNNEQISAFFQVPNSISGGTVKISILTDIGNIVINAARSVVYNDPSSLRRFIELGVNPDMKVYACDRNEYVPLIAKARTSEIIEELLKYGVNINQPMTLDGRTLLFLAIDRIFTEPPIEKLKNMVLAGNLLKHGADPKINYNEDASALVNAFEVLFNPNSDLEKIAASLIEIKAIQEKARERFNEAKVI